MSRFRRRPTVIGKAVKIRGEVSSDQNLLIEGCVTGSVTLADGELTVGKGGRVTATLKAMMVQVDGVVVGDIIGDRLVVVSRTGKVQGNLISPRIVLQPGARINGGIDMSAPGHTSVSQPD